MFHAQIQAFRERYNDIFYAVFRVLIGLLFAAHGAQKLFGLFTDNGPQAIVGSGIAVSWLGGLNMLWIAGVIEFFGGLLIAFGLWTGIAAALSGVNMLFAYFVGHFSLEAMSPLANRGELTLVYLSAFVLVLLMGGGKYSLDRRLWGTKAAPAQEMKH